MNSCVLRRSHEQNQNKAGEGGKAQSPFEEPKKQGSAYQLVRPKEGTSQDQGYGGQVSGREYVCMAQANGPEGAVTELHSRYLAWAYQPARDTFEERLRLKLWHLYCDKRDGVPDGTNEERATANFTYSHFKNPAGK